MKILLIFTLCLIADGGASKEVTIYSGGGVLIKCKYDKKYTQNQKYFCKGSAPVCSDQIKIGIKNEWIHLGRFSLFDDTESAEFRVMIRELTVQDTGTYQCGVDKVSGDIYTPVELKVKKESSVIEVTAYAGTRSNIKCKYEDEYKYKPKSFCKMEKDQCEFKHISTLPDSEWAHDDRFSVHDNRSAGFLSVFIRKLIKGDTGTYVCAVESDEEEIYTVVKLNVKEDLYYEKSINETVHVGGDLTVSCNYPESLRSNNKFLCRRTLTAACSYSLTVKESRTTVQKEKMSLYDDREKQIFTARIKRVTEHDSGEYWCGAEVRWRFANGYKLYFKRINLTVIGFSTSSHPTEFPFSFVITVLSVSVILLIILNLTGIVFLGVRGKLQGPKSIAYISRETNRANEVYEPIYESMKRIINQLDPETLVLDLTDYSEQPDSDSQHRSSISTC